MNAFRPLTHSRTMPLGRVARIKAPKAIVEMELGSAVPGRPQFMVLSAVQTVDPMESNVGVNGQGCL